MMKANICVYSCRPEEAAYLTHCARERGLRLALTARRAGPDSAEAAEGCLHAVVNHMDDLSAPALDALYGRGVRHVCTRTVGLCHIDLAHARRLGMAVDNAPYAPGGVADYAVMLLLMAVRRANAAMARCARGDYRLDGLCGRDLSDLTVGVMGAGRIGRAVIERLNGFGCRVLACDDRPARGVRAQFVAWPDLLRQSDAVTLHVPGGERNRHLIDAGALQMMKPGAILINTARGSLVDTGAVIGALREGRLGGAALDVVEEERGALGNDLRGAPPAQLEALRALPGAIVTPHAAFYTERALRESIEGAVDACLRFEREGGVAV